MFFSVSPLSIPCFFCVNAARWWTISMGFPVVMGDPQSSPWLGWFGGSRVAMYQPLMWGLHQWGYPPKWMGYFMDNPMKMDDLGVPTIYGNPFFVQSPSPIDFSISQDPPCCLKTRYPSIQRFINLPTGVGGICEFTDWPIKVPFFKSWIL